MLHVHYNSNEIGIPALSDIHQENPIGMSFEADDQDFDAHPEPDKLVLLAWASTTGDWAAVNQILLSRLPAGQPMPAESTLRFTAVDTAAGCSFDAFPLILKP